MAVLSVQQLTSAGVTPTFGAAAAGGDKFANNGRTFLVVKNGGGSEVTVTLDSKKNCDQGFDHNIQVAVAAGAEKWIGSLEPNRFNNSSGEVEASYSAVTSVTVAAVQV